MGKIKVIFLDVDGVLNSRKTERTTKNGYTFVGIRQLKNLKQIIAATGAKVVLSSDWRYDRDDPGHNSDFLELRDELRKYGIEFYGFTPEFLGAHRGAEIARSDIEPNKGHWVRTTMSRGLDIKETEDAIRILNGQP